MLSEKPVAATMPAVRVRLGFDASLGSRLSAGGLLSEALRQAVSTALVELLGALGIPGQPEVEITRLAPDRPPGEPFMAVVVNGSVCPYPDDLLHSVRAYVTGVLPQPGVSLDQLLGWLHELADPPSESTARIPEPALEYLALSCLEIIKLSPAVLLGAAQAESFCASLPVPAGSQPAVWLPPAGWLLPILRTVLGLRISLADRQAIANVLGQMRGRAPDDVAEALVKALRPPVVRLQVERAYLKQLTLADRGEPGAMFRVTRERLFRDLGMPYPEFHFAPVDGLKPGSFAFQINHLATPPFMGLQPDQCLVNDSVHSLRRLGVEAEPATNPATGLPAGVVAVGQRDTLTAAGLTPASQWDYLLLCFDVVLRRNAACLLDGQVAAGLLGKLETDFRALVNTLHSLVSEEQVTRVLRALVADELSIKDLPLILERLLDYDFANGDATGPQPVDQGSGDDWASHNPPLDNLDNVLASVRVGLRRCISDRYAHGSNSLDVYLLDPELETLLARVASRPVMAAPPADPLEDDEGAVILAAIRAEIGRLPPGVLPPVLLTALQFRPALAGLVSGPWPRMPVLAYQEVSPEFRIQIVAKVSRR